MKLRLVKLTEERMDLLTDMMDEWRRTGESIIPGAIAKEDWRDFEKYSRRLETKEETDRIVPDSTFFCLDEDRNIFVGAVNIRHRLNRGLLFHGGHIGDGVRPSERGKGVATRMIALALKEREKLGIKRVLMTCDKENVASAKSIIKNGGVLENEVEDGGAVIQRYWIDL